MKLKLNQIPRSVQYAVVLIFSGVVLTFVKLPAQIESDFPDLYAHIDYMLVLFFSAGVFYLLKLLLALMLLYRKNWARITFLVFCLLGIPFSLRGFFLLGHAFDISIPYGLSISLSLVIDYMALAYLFTASSKRWFLSGAVSAE
jgi:hypothetical protein